MTPDVEQHVGIRRDELAALFLLEGIRGFGPGKFKDLFEAGLRPADVLADPHRLPATGRRGEMLRTAIAKLTVDDRQEADVRAVRQLVRAAAYRARIVTYESELYPSNAYASNNPVPVLTSTAMPGSSTSDSVLRALAAGT